MSALHLQFSQVYCDVCSSVQYLQKYDLYKKLSLFILIKKKQIVTMLGHFSPHIKEER